MASDSGVISSTSPVAPLLLPFLLMIARPLRDQAVSTARRVTWVGASLLLIAPWAQLAWKGNADDALVLVDAAVMVTALTTAGTGGWCLDGCWRWPANRPRWR